MGVAENVVALGQRIGAEFKSVRTLVATKAPIASPTFTGTVTLPGNPSAALHATPKQYADTKWPLLAPVTASAATTAVSGTLVLANAASGAFTITLPVATTGAVVEVKKIDASANVVTVAAGSGNTVGSLNAASIPIRLTDQAAIFLANGTNWVIASGYQALSSLDARYGPFPTQFIAPNTSTDFNSTTYTYMSGLQATINVGSAAESYDVTATLDMASYFANTATFVVVIEPSVSANGSSTTFPVKITTNGDRFPMTFAWILSGMAPGSVTLRMAGYLTGGGSYQVGSGSTLKVRRGA